MTCSEMMPSEKKREKKSDDDDDDDCGSGGQYPTYQRRQSSLVSDSDSVEGTIVMCRTEVW